MEAGGERPSEVERVEVLDGVDAGATLLESIVESFVGNQGFSICRDTRCTITGYEVKQKGQSFMWRDEALLTSCLRVISRLPTLHRPALSDLPLQPNAGWMARVALASVMHCAC